MPGADRIPGPPLAHRARVALACGLAALVRERDREDGGSERRLFGLLLRRVTRLGAGRARSELFLGRLLRSEELLDGRRDGETVDWRGPQARHASVQWKAGLRDGSCRVLWPDGRTRAYGTFRAGRADGEWWFARRDGSMDRARTGLWRDGARIGGIKGFNDWLGSP